MGSDAKAALSRRVVVTTVAIGAVAAPVLSGAIPNPFTCGGAYV
jgi:hypothetical protein